MGSMVTFASNGGTADGYLTEAEGGGPGLILVQEWWGLVGHIKDVAERFASAGFTTLAPDFFHGATTGEPDEAMRLMMGLAMDQAAKDVAGAATYLSGLDSVTSQEIGVVGFCMGGSLALWSGALADEVKVAVGFYPAVPWEKMSPTWGNYANKSAMIHASEEDGTSKADGIQAAVKGIQEAGGDVEVYDYPGSSHAFFNDQRPEVHSKEHSEQAWRRTLDLLKGRL